jgi:tetratricopeptide (TPR) repeat protein
LNFFPFLLLAVGGCESQDEAVGGPSPGQGTKEALLAQLDKKFENPDAHYKLGRLYAAEGRYDRAEYHFKTAMEFDPVHVRAQAAMVKMLAAKSDEAEAKSAADEYIEAVSDSVGGLLRLGQAFMKQELDDYALACYQRALKLEPESAQANKLMGYYYLEKRDQQRAKQYLMRSFEAEPNQPNVARELGRLGVVVEVPRVPGSETDGSQQGAPGPDEPPVQGSQE